MRVFQFVKKVGKNDAGVVGGGGGWHLEFRGQEDDGVAVSRGLRGIDVDVVINIVSWSRANGPTVLTATRPSGNALGFWFINNDFCAQWSKRS